MATTSAEADALLGQLVIARSKSRLVVGRGLEEWERSLMVAVQTIGGRGVPGFQSDDMAVSGFGLGVNTLSLATGAQNPKVPGGPKPAPEPKDPVPKVPEPGPTTDD